MNIYLKDYTRKKGDTVYDVICELYSLTDNSFENGFSSLFSRMTFLEKECKNKQCKSGANRSFKDIHLLCQTYFPNVSRKKVAKTLREIIEKYSERTTLAFLYCPTINHWTFVSCGKWKPENILHAHNYAYYDKKPHQKGTEDTLSLYEILQLMGYNKDEILINKNLVI